MVVHSSHPPPARRHPTFFWGKELTKNHTLQPWRVEDSAELYGIHSWGAGFFDISDAGEVVICPKGPEGPRVPIPEIIGGIRERGYELPCLLRVENILDTQISNLHESFRKAIKSLGYNGSYRGVFPIKVNQQQQVIEEIAQFGSNYHHGLEVGSKAELIAAVSLLHDPEACLICNGYKDGEFIDLGLQAQRVGLNVFFVLENAGELDTVLERARILGLLRTSACAASSPPRPAGTGPNPAASVLSSAFRLKKSWTSWTSSRNAGCSTACASCTTISAPRSPTSATSAAGPWKAPGSMWASCRKGLPRSGRRPGR